MLLYVIIPCLSMWFFKRVYEDFPNTQVAQRIIRKFYCLLLLLLVLATVNERASCKEAAVYRYSFWQLYLKCHKAIHTSIHTSESPAQECFGNFWTTLWNWRDWNVFFWGQTFWYGSSHWRSSLKNVFLKISRNSQKTPVPESLF